MKSKIIILSAPSGSGKTTIAQALLQEPLLHLAFSISATSRNPRKNELHGKDYYFFSVEEFKKMIELDKFVEWEEVYDGLFYGTLREEIDRLQQAGLNILFDVDVKGGENLKKTFAKQALSIFIMPPSLEELEKRLTNRNTETELMLNERIKLAKKELRFADKFDKVVVNRDLNTAVREVMQLAEDFIFSEDE